MCRDIYKWFVFVRTDFLGDIHQRSRQQITQTAINACACDCIRLNKCWDEGNALVCVCRNKSKMFIECRIEGTTMNRKREGRGGRRRMEFV